MSVYGPPFAAVYDTHWGAFAEAVSPLVLARLRRRRPGVALHVLDLGCGTGITAALLEAHGCTVTGLDGSEAMLDIARGRVGPGTTLVRAGLHQPPPGPYDVVLCLFDTLNHLAGVEELDHVIAAAAHVTRPGALFVFDLATQRNVRSWDGSAELDGEQPLTVSGRCSPEGEGAWVDITITGRADDGSTWRHAQREVSFELATVAEILGRRGWGNVRWTTYDDLSQTVTEPESHGRIVGECVRA